MKFTKMHGLGNDYVFVNTFDERVDDPESLARAVSDRHRGIGSDGLILIGPSNIADLSMRIYNADGSRGEMCGNGIRCVARLAYERGLTRKAELRIETDAGVREAVCLLVNGRVESVCISMGCPRFDADSLPAQTHEAELIDFPLEVGSRTLNATCVSVGNPHAVMFLSSWEQIELHRDGPLVEKHSMFPRRINAQFAMVEDDHHIVVKTWERGSGPTQACGTGACAVAAAAVKTRRAKFPITIQLPGGELLIERAHEADGGMWMTGPATHVFDGDWPG